MGKTLGSAAGHAVPYVYPEFPQPMAQFILQPVVSIDHHHPV